MKEGLDKGMKHWLRLILSISLAIQILVISVSPISALTDTNQYKYAYQIGGPDGIIILSKKPMVIALISGTLYIASYYSSNAGYYTGDSFYCVLCPQGQAIGGNYTYTVFVNRRELNQTIANSNICNYNFELNNGNVVYPVNWSQNYISGQLTFNYNNVNYNLRYGISTDTTPIISRPDLDLTDSPSVSYYPADGNSQFMGTNGSYNESLSTILDDFNKQDSTIDDIINVGQGMYIPSNGVQLGQAEQQLSNSEDAILSKSESLQSGVADQWSTNITTAKTLSTTLAPAAATVTNLYTTIMTAVPAEVKALYVAIPMLLFVGWAIGRVDK